jgi:hypothetical protein
LFDLKIAEYVQPLVLAHLEVDGEYAESGYLSDSLFTEELIQIGQAKDTDFQICWTPKKREPTK